MRKTPLTFVCDHDWRLGTSAENIFYIVPRSTAAWGSAASRPTIRSGNSLRMPERPFTIYGKSCIIAARPVSCDGVANNGQVG